MSQSIDVRMLNALELFHYSCRFQNRLFVLLLEDGIDLQDLITDIRVLASAQIHTVVICQEHDKLAQLLQVWNSRGCPFSHERTSTVESFADLIPTLQQHLQAGAIPVIGIPQDKAASPPRQILYDLTMTLIDHLTVDKVFYLSKLPGLRVDRQFVSHTTPDDISRILTARHHLNIDRERLAHLSAQNRRHGCDIVLLKGKRGNLFQEIFTHRGKGTLLTSDYPNIIRPGRLSDVMDIMLLMKPYIRSGSILPVSEDELAAEIEAYFVYTVNNSIVAVARLKDYGEAAELAKFCTLPRYQGKGRARELAERMIETARNQHKTYIFALSVEPRMFVFFRNLGFQVVERGQLPADWRRQYDLNRPSRAFQLDIGVDAG